MNSENPNQKPSETEGSNRPSDEQGGCSQPQVPPASGSAKLNSPKTPESNEIPCKTHRDWLDYTMLVVQGIGVVFLIAYTTFAALQWCEFKRANNIASDTLEFNRKLIVAAQAAGFDCRADFYPNLDKPWERPVIQVTCVNKGKNNASNVAGEIGFARFTADGKVAQNETRNVEQNVVIPTGGIAKLFGISIPFDFQSYAKQRIKAHANLSYDNGLSRVSQNFCFELIVTPLTRNYTMTDCDNAETARQYPH